MFRRSGCSKPGSQGDTGPLLRSASADELHYPEAARYDPGILHHGLVGVLMSAFGEREECIHGDRLYVIYTRAHVSCTQYYGYYG